MVGTPYLELLSSNFVGKPHLGANFDVKFPLGARCFLEGLYGNLRCAQVLDVMNEVRILRVQFPDPEHQIFFEIFSGPF